jgi:hypothetical protein
VRSLIRSKMARLPLVLATLFALAFLTSCGTRVILPNRGDPVRLAEPTKARLYVYDKDGKMVEVQGVIPAGWWAVDGPKDE